MDYTHQSAVDLYRGVVRSWLAAGILQTPLDRAGRAHESRSTTALCRSFYYGHAADVGAGNSYTGLELSVCT